MAAVALRSGESYSRTRRRRAGSRDEAGGGIAYRSSSLTRTGAARSGDDTAAFAGRDIAFRSGDSRGADIASFGAVRCDNTRFGSRAGGARGTGGGNSLRAR